MTKNSDRCRDGSVQPVSRLLRSWIAKPLVRWHRRNVLYREMMFLDERTLVDIGMSWSEVLCFVLCVDLDGDRNSQSPMSQTAPRRWRMFDDPIAV